MSVPQHIISVIESYKRPGERYIICPQVAEYEGKVYYGASYHKGGSSRATGYFIVEDNGSIPKKCSVKTVLLIILGISHMYRTFHGTVLKYARRNLSNMERAKKTLLKVKAFAEKKRDQDFLSAIEKFIEVPETCLEQQHRLKNVAQEMADLFDIGEKTGVLTFELLEEMSERHYKLGKALFFQNYIQMQTYQARKKVIWQLIKYGKLFWALSLWLFHLQLHPEHVKPRDQEDYEMSKKRFLENVELDIESIELEKDFQVTRNPD